MGRRTLSIAGRRIDVLDIDGDAHRRTLVLLHEGLGSIGLWREFPAQLAKRTGRRTVVYSRHGHGRSENPPVRRTPSFFHEEARVTLPELLWRLDVSEPVLVGHSDGGSIALIHGAATPVTGVVTLAAHVFVEDICVRSIEETRRRYVDGDLRPRLARHHDDPDAAFWGWCDVWLDPAFRTWTLDSEVAAITAPILVIQGHNDPYGTLAQVERICDAVGPSARSLIVPGGHSPHLDASEEVLAGISGFCADLG